MRNGKHALFFLALGMPGLGGSLVALALRGGEHVFQVLTIGTLSMCGPGLFLAGVMSLLGTRTFLRNAVVAKGGVSDIYEFTPAETRDGLLPGRIVTIHFWTEQEEAITIHRHTFEAKPETTPCSIQILYDRDRSSEAKIRSFEGLWLTSGLVLVLGAGLTLIFGGLLGSVLR